MHRPVHLPRTEVHTLTSEVTGEVFELWIGHPMEGWASVEGQPTELLFLLDANLFFGMALEMTRLMHALFGELPPILVAGVAYPDVDVAEQSRLRTGHFTPSPDPIFAEAARAMAPPGTPVTSIPMGGADDFLALLRDQVDPLVRNRFGLTSSSSTLFGTSLGGLFGAHVLRTAPDWLDRIIIGSPSLWWHEEEIFAQIAAAEAGVAGTGTTGPDVVVTVGSGEEGPAIPHLNRYKLVTNARRLADECARGSLPCRSVHFEVIEGESHTSVVPSALTRGLRRLLTG